MNFIPTYLAGAYIIEPKRVGDSRGWFGRLFCASEISEVCDFSIRQINRSFNKVKGTLRGMHYQNTPFCEAKIVQCIHGAVLDVIVDIRAGSETFLKTFEIELSEENGKMLLIPKGFAHGFQTLQDDTSLLYFHDTDYVAGYEGGVAWNDPKLGLSWPMPVSVISDKDSVREFLRDDFKGI